MKRNQLFIALALVGVVVGTACNTKSPTAPTASPTPASYSIALTVSSSQVETNSGILFSARITSGGQNVADGTAVTFKITGCVAGTSATDPSFENGTCEMTRTTSGGVATATVFSQHATIIQVVARVAGASASINVRWVDAINPRTLAIYSIVPNVGQWTGREPVTIKGRGFLAPVKVDFNISGNVRHAEVLSVAADGTSVSVLTPPTDFAPKADLPVDVIVTAAYGTTNAVTDTLVAGFTYLFPVTPPGGDPQIYAIVPAYGSVAGGETVMIYGANFVLPVKVKFGAEDVQVVSVSSDFTTLTLLTPKHSGNPGIVDVTITAGAGKIVTRAGGFTWIPAGGTPPVGTPEIFTVVPSVGSVNGGETVTIYGANFAKPVTVTFGAENIQVVSVSSDNARITVLTPKHVGAAAPLTVDVTVMNWDGKSVTLAAGFKWVAGTVVTGPPLIYSLVPSRGLVTGGDPVTIYGANFASPLTVTFGAENVTVVSVSSDNTQIAVLTPQHSGAVDATKGTAVDVTVTNWNKDTVTRSGGWTWLAVSSNPGAPVIYQVQPTKGSPRGGETVQILGTNLCGTVNTVTQTCDSNPTVQFGLPTGAVTVQILSLSPDGKQLTVITPQVSPNPVLTDVTVDITVSNGLAPNTGTFTLAKAFTFVGESAPPIVYYCQPATGSNTGGDLVTIFGRYLLQPVKVQFNPGGTAIVGSVAADSTSVQVTTPLNPPVPKDADTKADVVVTTQYGTGRDQSVTLSSGFTWLASVLTPELYSLTPNSGPIEGGTRVTIEGTGFQYPVQVLFGDRQAQVVSSNLTEIICISPSISVTQPSTPTTVQVSVTNTKTGKVSASTLPFRYGEAIFVSSIAPGVGPDTGGTTVTVFGQGFSAPVAVTFADVPAQVLTVSGTEIVATTGAVLQRKCDPITGAVKVTNINSSITATGPNWTYTPADPLITSISVSGTGASGNSIPRFGSSCNSGTYTMTINGHNFEAGNMRVTFGTTKIDVPANVVSPTALTVTVPNLSSVVMLTAACVTGGVAGTLMIPTPVDITVTNVSNKCSDTLTGGLIITPCHASGDDVCVVPPVTPTVTITPPTQSVSVAAGRTDLALLVTYTPTSGAPATATITYTGALFLTQTPPPGAPPASVALTNGVGTLHVSVPAGTGAGLSETITVSAAGAPTASSAIVITIP